jgi:signal transduction histidine kinase
MKNTYDMTSIKKRGLKFLSSKKNRQESHGIGLFNINETVNKYGGAFQIEEKEDIFQVMIMLPEKTS